MSQTGLRFMLRYSHYVDLILTTDHAHQMLHRFAELSRKPTRTGEVFEGVDLRGGAYVIDAAAILGAHTVPLQPATPPAGPGGVPVIQTNRSGIL